MNSIRKVVNNIKFPKSLNISLNIDGSGLLHNKSILYLIFAISFGNFMLELIGGDFYFVVIYLIIGFLTTFFNKNMIVVLLMSTIFANILKYGNKSTEGFEASDENILDQHDQANDDIDSALPIDMPIKILDSGDKKKSKKHHKKSHKKSDDDSDDESDNESGNESDNESVSERSTKKKHKKEPYTDRELDSMKYKDSEKMLENQRLLLKNMKDFKPFFDTLKGIAGNFSDKKGEKSEE